GRPSRDPHRRARDGSGGRRLVLSPRRPRTRLSRHPGRTLPPAAGEGAAPLHRPPRAGPRHRRLRLSPAFGFGSPAPEIRAGEERPLYPESGRSLAGIAPWPGLSRPPTSSTGRECGRKTWVPGTRPGTGKYNSPKTSFDDCRWVVTC